MVACKERGPHRRLSSTFASSFDSGEITLVPIISYVFIDSQIEQSRLGCIGGRRILQLIILQWDRSKRVEFCPLAVLVFNLSYHYCEASNSLPNLTLFFFYLSPWKTIEVYVYLTCVESMREAISVIALR